MRLLAINYYSLKKKRWYYFFNMTFSYILTQSSSSKGDQYEKKMATAILLFFKKRKYHHNRELSSTSARYIFKKNSSWFNRGNKTPNKARLQSSFQQFSCGFLFEQRQFFIHSRALWEQWFFESLCTYWFMSDDKITPSCNYFLCLREIYQSGLVLQIKSTNHAHD